ncbi:hypothetical protein CDAR_24691 [Caerostris darwini]|uniref:Uncharacterized protein n=1 Tax=Caerostris darwini TaxID=1538125 RepID=A0AAV4QAM3_9ARAC|nr:hypothetical protein CDAR_24691 [Caerostris darwini]
MASTPPSFITLWEDIEVECHKKIRPATKAQKISSLEVIFIIASDCRCWSSLFSQGEKGKRISYFKLEELVVGGGLVGNVTQLVYF